MNIQLAFEELEITVMHDIDIKYIKKQYHKLALKYHPDKNTSESSKQKFQKINEAYNYLLNIFEETSDDYSDVSSEDPTIYINILTAFIASFFDQDTISIILKEIVANYENITLSFLTNKFEQLDKQNSIDLFLLLHKYKDVFHINSETLHLVSLIISEKHKNDKLFILHPQFEDVLNHNVFKLVDDDQTYLVPLWHTELHFDSPNKTHDVIVLCHPLLPTNIQLDDYNNIYTEIYISIKNQLSELLKTNRVSLSLGKKTFDIPLDKLCIKEQQIYRIKGEGIAHISDNMYNTASKSDIIIKIILND
jgi:hypothetical protein